jgi:glycopeptide antibiotics resistance protein
VKAGRLPGPPRGPLPHQGWLDYLGTYDIARTTLVLLPVALLAVLAMARHRERTGASTQQAWVLSLAEVCIVYLTLPALWITLLPGARSGEVPSRVSLVPLRDLATMNTFQIVGNLLLLTALGFFAPVRYEALASVPRMLAVAASLSASIETAQYVLRLDRVASVDDVLLNTVGAGLAALASRPWWRVRRSRDTEPHSGGTLCPMGVRMRLNDASQTAHVAARSRDQDSFNHSISGEDPC